MSAEVLNGLAMREPLAVTSPPCTGLAAPGTIQ
jgi:hypothetical protein